MIPKIIHYFWLGGSPKSETVEKYIESWKRNCPEFEIREWNETNYDIHKHPFMEKAYNEKKWAFVSDYARLDVLYEFGGIYLDTDVEVIKDLSPLCVYKAFEGFENPKLVNNGQGFGCEAGMPIIKEMMKLYDGDSPYELIEGKSVPKESPKICTEVLVRQGLKQDGSRQTVGDVEILPVDYLCPMNYKTGRVKITENTYSIHHFSGSWHTGKTSRLYLKYMRFLNIVFGEKLGDKLYNGSMKAKDNIKKFLKK